MSDCLCSKCSMINICQNYDYNRREDIDLEQLIGDMASKTLIKGNYGDYIIYNKDWLYAFLDDEVEILRKCREVKEKIDGR